MAFYRCLKIVQAWRIKSIHGATLDLEGYGIMDVDEKIFSRYEPVPGDYMVKYADGYVSVSPALAFEEGYAPLI